jgi:hypothetical protein
VRVADELKATRVAAAREQRLMASAFHNMGMQIQRTDGSIGKSSGGLSSFLGNQRRGLEFSSRGK